jgi:hypothetical protein
MKNKISINDLEKRGMIEKFDRQGVNRETLMKSLYRETDGMKQQDRTKLVQKLFDREYTK